MARRRGFFAEMQHQARVAEQRHQQALRQQSAAVRRAEQAQRAAERAQAAAVRASEQDRKRLEREAALAHIDACRAEVEKLNSALQDKYQVLDSLLAATLDVDDFVDLETLRVVAKHPSFPRVDLKVPVPAPKPIPDPPLPVKQEPEVVKGMFGRKQKAVEAQAAVERQYAEDYWAWKAATEALPARRAAQDATYKEAEERRKAQLAAELATYEAECAARDAEAKEQSDDLDQLIAGLGYGTADAVKEYVEIVLANSVYPEDFPVTHSSLFEPSTAELFVSVRIPGPETVPTVKQYRYVKTHDEITPTAATQKDTKERYAGIVNNVALRTLHEVFEADRRGLIRSISLELGTETISPATGQPLYVPFVAVAANREQFRALDLRAVVPAATLAHLGAAVSKNPQGLVPIASGGIRRGNE